MSFKDYYNVGQAAFRAYGAARAAGARVPYMADLSRGNNTINREVRPADTAGVGELRFRKTKTRTGSRRRMTKMQKIMLFQGMRQNSFICRFQCLWSAPYSNSTGGPGIISFLGKVGQPEAMMMPVYAFNLTAPGRLNIGGVDYASAPFYRLRKAITATGAADALTPNYDWVPQYGQITDGVNVSQIWQHERTTADTRCAGTYIHDWTNIGLTLSGASALSVPLKCHVIVGRFTNDGAGPLRQYSINEGVTMRTFDTQVSKEDTSRADLFWDKFLSDKTVHPLRTVLPMANVKATIGVVSHQCVCVMPGGTLSKEVFHAGNRIYNTTSMVAAEQHHRPDINTGQAPCFNVQETVYTSNMFPRKNQDTWLIVCAENFDAPVETEAVANSHYFNLNVRAKFTVQT